MVGDLKKGQSEVNMLPTGPQRLLGCQEVIKRYSSLYRS